MRARRNALVESRTQRSWERESGGRMLNSGGLSKHTAAVYCSTPWYTGASPELETLHGHLLCRPCVSSEANALFGVFNNIYTLGKY